MWFQWSSSVGDLSLLAVCDWSLSVLLCVCVFVSLSGPAAKLLQRTPRRRGQQPKLLNSPEDSIYYSQLNVSSKLE